MSAEPSGSEWGAREAFEALAVVGASGLVDRVEVETDEAEQEAAGGRQRDQVAQRLAHRRRLRTRSDVVAGHTSHTS